MGIYYRGSLFLTSCTLNSTFLRQTWTNPEAKPIAFKKIFVVAVVPEESLRRSAEDAIVSKLGSFRSTPSYSFVPREIPAMTTEKVKDLVKERGFDESWWWGWWMPKQRRRYFIPATLHMPQVPVGTIMPMVVQLAETRVIQNTIIQLRQIL